MVRMFKVLGIVHPGWRCRLTRKHPKAEINVWAVYSIKRNLTFTIQEVKGISKEKLASFLSKQRKVLDFYIVPYSTLHIKHIVAVWDKQKYITMKLLSLRCFPLKPINIKNGIAKWIIACESVKGLFSVIDAITKHKGYKLVYVRTAKDVVAETSYLTNKQLLVLKEALNKGYYTYPRKISLRRLAENLKISTSTLAKTLRLAERKILENTIM